MDRIKLELDIYNRHTSKDGFLEYITNIQDFYGHMFDDKLIDLFKYKNNINYLIDNAYECMELDNVYKSYRLYSKYLSIVDSMNLKIGELLDANKSVKKLENKISDTHGTAYYKLKDKNYGYTLIRRANEYKNIYSKKDIFYRNNYLKTLVSEMEKVLEENKKDLKGDFMIYKTDKTPEVSLSQAYDYYSIKGRCFPIYSDKFWDPILEWIEFNKEKILPGSLLEINLDYINTSSLSYLYRFLNYLEDKGMYINWYYDSGDDDMLEMIDDMVEQFPCHVITKIKLDV